MMITSVIAVIVPSLVIGRQNDSPGLTKIKGYKTEVSGTSIEIEGVCKITEDSVSCWSPSGKKMPTLSSEIERGLTGSNYSSGRINIQYRKKNRILVIKKVSPPNNSSYINGNTEDLSTGDAQFKEGWRSDSYWPEAQSTGFDRTSTSRKIVFGAFEEKTKTFPYRYVIQGSGQKSERFPFKAGTVISSGGNSIEISAIGDKLPVGKEAPWSFIKDLPWESSFATIKILSGKNLFQGMSINALNEKGEVFYYVDINGSPLTSTEYHQLSLKHGHFGNFGRGMHFVSAIGFDPGMSKSTSNEFVHHFPLAASLIHSLELTVSTRKIFQFENIRLDPK